MFGKYFLIVLEQIKKLAYRLLNGVSNNVIKIYIIQNTFNLILPFLSIS